MASMKLCLVLISTLLGICTSAFVDTLQKCNIEDGNCKDMLQKIIGSVANSGVPELEIPTLDPMALQNVKISLINVIDFDLIDGTVTGIKDCVVDKFTTDLKSEQASIEVTCDVQVKGKYKAFSDSPLIKSFLGGETVHGEGNLEAKIDKIHIKMDFSLYVQKKSDGLYIQLKDDKIAYDYSIGNLNVVVDNLYLGNQEASETIANVINQNWQALVPSFGKPFLDKVMDYVSEYIHNFFDKVPTQHYILGDVSQYARD